VTRVTTELLRQLEFVHSRQSDPDCGSRMVWAIGEITRIASREERVLQALRFLAPTVQYDGVDIACRVAGTHVEADPLYQALRLQRENVLNLYNELEKENVYG
jgi:hypothetical protein